ncbi:hypothetical protein CDD81_1519 [Ophiocordyceps australis]|uniref:acetylornithine transaminase n=1 Tax=Ophiocordyceps australis TaxID=1399860 RepID=A0A2C5YET5_9HYPO|nr:hypothetical protein CDD81_1519 [Ophiocordyceps australis]
MASRVGLRTWPGLVRFASGSVSAAKDSNVAHKAAAALQGQERVATGDSGSDSGSAKLVADYAPYMVATYARPPPVFVRGSGSWLWDMEQRRYLDMTAGIAVTALGHCDSECARIVADQAQTLVHASNLYYNPWTGALSKLLVNKTLESGGMHDAQAVFVCNSGSEANEAAIKFARKVGKQLDGSGAKHQVLSFSQAFHGRTMGSLSATHNAKYQQPFAPMLPGFHQAPFNDIDAMTRAVTEHTCGVIVEPIQGEGGVQTASVDFMVALARRCRQVGALVIHDEIQCGLGRTGKLWAHGFLPPEAHPDVLTTAKALGNGFPVGAAVVNAKVAHAIKVGDHGTTFGGNPLACRVAHYMVSRLSDPALLQAVEAKSSLLADALQGLCTSFPNLALQVRGRGLILGLQLSQDPSPIVKAARDRGLLIITAGTNTLRFVPSLLVTEDEIAMAVEILYDAMASTCNQ